MNKGEEKETKKLAQYKQTKPEQLLLFEFTTLDEKKYSNTIELYDAIPKYYWGNVERENGRYLSDLKRTFEFRGKKYRVTIRPARIEDRRGVTREYYPSQREELVEDALRKLACDGKGLFLDDQAGVMFSLYELQQELKRMGHGYSIVDIKDALLICAQTNMILETEDGLPIAEYGKATLVSHLFETLGLQTREDWKGHGNKSKAYVRFNVLVTNSIKALTFRQLNYEKCMSYKSVIARQLHKRMSHLFTQSSLTNTYSILLSTIIRDFGIKAYSQLRDNLYQVEQALDEMKEKEVIAEYKVEKSFDPNRKNKMIEAKFIITPHSRFTSDMIKANERHRKLKNYQPLFSK
ncbi:MAG: hypothetical protein AB1489_38620 [Acidobacteriota bacterium]